MARPVVIEAFDARLPVPGIAGLMLRTPGGYLNAAASRVTAWRGREAGGALLGVLASDLPLAGSRFAIDQAIGGGVLRAAELHVPAVRASLGGVAVVVSSDGRVLARSTPGESSAARGSSGWRSRRSTCAVLPEGFAR